ncbi:MAG: hypothetical protein RSA01_03970 [Clostridium sp.]|uniref:hypothetical protein n=1 Tax=Clostridium sp. TaxID=1506 RepID=UPI002FCA01B1
MKGKVPTESLNSNGETSYLCGNVGNTNDKGKKFDLNEVEKWVSNIEFDFRINADEVKRGISWSLICLELKNIKWEDSLKQCEKNLEYLASIYVVVNSKINCTHKDREYIQAKELLNKTINITLQRFSEGAIYFLRDFYIRNGGYIESNFVENKITEIYNSLVKGYELFIKSIGLNSLQYEEWIDQDRNYLARLLREEIGVRDIKGLEYSLSDFYNMKIYAVEIQKEFSYKSELSSEEVLGVAIGIAEIKSEIMKSKFNFNSNAKQKIEETFKTYIENVLGKINRSNLDKLSGGSGSKYRSLNRGDIDKVHNHMICSYTLTGNMIESISNGIEYGCKIHTIKQEKANWNKLKRYNKSNDFYKAISYRYSNNNMVSTLTKEILLEEYYSFSIEYLNV